MSEPASIGFDADAIDPKGQPFRVSAQEVIRPEDLDWADRLEESARASGNYKSAEMLMEVVNLRRNTPDHPVLDDPRPFANKNGRVVINRYGPISPFSGSTATQTTLPVRLVHYADGDDRLLLEVGPYDLGEDDINVLHRAIGDCRRAQGTFDTEDKSKSCLVDFDDLVEAARGFIRKPGHTCGVSLADIVDELNFMFVGGFELTPEVQTVLELLDALRNDENVFTFNDAGMQFMWVESPGQAHAAIADPPELIRRALSRDKQSE